MGQGGRQAAVSATHRASKEVQHKLGMAERRRDALDGIPQQRSTRLHPARDRMQVTPTWSTVTHQLHAAATGDDTPEDCDEGVARRRRYTRLSRVAADTKASRDGIWSKRVISEQRLKAIARSVPLVLRLEAQRVA
jgi:hypothetical protein